MRAIADLTGQTFGRYTVISRSVRSGNHAYCVCQCACGNVRTVDHHNLTGGKTKSCGCYRAEVSKEKETEHGLSNTRLYHIWRGIINRCENSNVKNYAQYGGRGISMCEEWRKDFLKFYDWSMKNGYSDNLSVDRKDNDGNYEPSNCRWATGITQANNRRSSHVITYQGRTQTLVEWARELNIPAIPVYNRINRLGWTPERAFSTPI